VQDQLPVPLQRTPQSAGARQRVWKKQAKQCIKYNTTAKLPASGSGPRTYPGPTWRDMLHMSAAGGSP